MWQLINPWHELVLRAVVLFSFLFLVFRLWGKKHFGQLAPFDFILLLVISEGMQSALTAGDDSLTGGMIVILTLVTLNTILNRLSFSSPVAQKIIEGEPVPLITNGKVLGENLKRETIAYGELMEALREHGVQEPSQVHLATLETDGQITIIKQKDVVKMARTRK